MAFYLHNYTDFIEKPNHLMSTYIVYLCTLTMLYIVYRILVIYLICHYSMIFAPPNISRQLNYYYPLYF